MNRVAALILSISVAVCAVMAQTPQSPQKPSQEIGPEDILRITTELVPTDVVVTDKNDQVVTDLKLEDFEVYDNGAPRTDSCRGHFVSDTIPNVSAGRFGPPLASVVW